MAGVDEALPSSHRVPGVRAELLARAGLATEAASAYEQAIALCGNDAERRHLIAQRAKLGG